MQEKLKHKGKASGTSNTSQNSATSDEEIDLKKIKRKMSKKQRDQRDHRMSSRLKQIGAVFPDDDFTTASSGTDYSKAGCKHSSRQIKSGAKVRKRPVIKTELWPHTIANEEDGGEEVSSDSISLAKFMSCFTYIMLNCGKVESKGRTVLLHAISLILESLYWPDARTFHNLVMTKLEQDRYDWATDFVDLANAYIDKKVRLSLKSKSSGNKAGASYKKSSGYSYSNGNKNFSKNSNRTFLGKSKMLHNSICRQWNAGACTYGDKCNRWHVCWTCAEGGKVGELHKASSHGNAVAKSNS